MIAAWVLATLLLGLQAAARRYRTLNIGTYNIGDGAPEKKYRDLTRLARGDKKTPGLDVILIQEAGDRTQLLLRWCRHNGFTAFLGEGAGASSTPILYRNTLKVGGLWTQQATTATRVGDPGAGPPVIKAKGINHIRVSIGALRGVHVLNLHGPASVTRPNLPNVEKRRSILRKLIDTVTDLIRSRKGWKRVVVGGDFNAETDFPLLRPLGVVGLQQIVNEDTHGNRTIDHLWIDGLRVVERWVTTGLSSDHESPGVTLAA